MPASATLPALGSTATIVVDEPEALPAARAELEAELERIDLACSRFREDSELERVNREAGRPVAIGPLLVETLGHALRAATLTGGAVDPTVGTALAAIGYDRDFDEIDGERPPAPTAPAPGPEAVELDAAAGTVRLAPGARLDLGAVAKALAADRAARAAATAAGTGVLVSLGGDIAVAGPPPAEGWYVRVTDDHRSGPDAPGQTVRIETGGLATSSTTVRRWGTGAAERHHIVDPTTGASAPVVWRTVSVVAATCVDANIASTASVVRGEAAVAWLSGAKLPARLVRRDGSVVRVAGWPADNGESG